MSLQQTPLQAHDTQRNAERITALEQRQHRLIRQLRYLLAAVIFLTGLACMQQVQSRQLLTQHEGLVKMMLQLELFQEQVVRAGHGLRPGRPPVRLHQPGQAGSTGACTGKWSHSEPEPNHF